MLVTASFSLHGVVVAIVEQWWDSVHFISRWSHSAVTTIIIAIHAPCYWHHCHHHAVVISHWLSICACFVWGNTHSPGCCLSWADQHRCTDSNKAVWKDEKGGVPANNSSMTPDASFPLIVVIWVSKNECTVVIPVAYVYRVCWENNQGCLYSRTHCVSGLLHFSDGWIRTEWVSQINMCLGSCSG